MNSNYFSGKRHRYTRVSNLALGAALVWAVALVLACGHTWAQIEEEAADGTPDGDGATKQSAMPKRSPQQQLLAQALPDSAVLWLPQGSREFLALYRPALTTKAAGTVLLLHGAGQHPDWPGTLSDLRHYLPSVGWSTLAIALPDPEVPKPPRAKPAKARTPGGDNSDDGSAGESETDAIYDAGSDRVDDGVDIPANKQSDDEKEKVVAPGMEEELAVDRIITAMNFIRQQGEGLVVIYAQGTGATRAGEYLQEADSNLGVDALVFVDAQNRVPLREFDLTQALTDPDLPLLDLLQNSTAQADSDASERWKRAQMIYMQHYRRMDLAPSGGASEPVMKIIYGFLKSTVQP